MGWFRRTGFIRDPDRVLSYDAQVIVQAHQQAMAGMERAYTLPEDARASAMDLAPVAGVSVQVYAQICRSFGSTPIDAQRMASAAQRQGVTPDTWAQAFDEWNTRCMRNVDVAEAFIDAYQTG